MSEEFKHFVPGCDIKTLPIRPANKLAGGVVRIKAALEASLIVNAVMVALLLALGSLLVAYSRDNIALHLEVAHMHDQIQLLKNR